MSGSLRFVEFLKWWHGYRRLSGDGAGAEGSHCFRYLPARLRLQWMLGVVPALLALCMLTLWAKNFFGPVCNSQFWHVEAPSLEYIEALSHANAATASIQWFQRMLRPVDLPNFSGGETAVSFNSTDSAAGAEKLSEKLRSDRDLAVIPPTRSNRARRLYPYQVPFHPWGVILAWRALHVFPSETNKFQWGLKATVYLAMMELWSNFIWVASEMNLTWFVEAGSALGSLRHWDMIPWDDDVDLRILDEGWKQLLAVLAEGKRYPHLAAREGPWMGGILGKIWMKDSIYPLKNWTQPYRYPFLDVWVVKRVQRRETWPVPWASSSVVSASSSSYQFLESRKRVVSEEVLFPLHYRPMGPFWVPVAHRPFDLFNMYYSSSGTDPPGLLEQCASSTWNHQEEHGLGGRARVPCRSLALDLPLVVGRFPRSMCPYTTTRGGFSLLGFLGWHWGSASHASTRGSRLVRCLGAPTSERTTIIVANPAHFSGDALLRHYPPDWLQPMNFTAETNDSSEAPPLQFVWECPFAGETREQMDTNGIIEILAIGGVPFGIMEICAGSYAGLPSPTGVGSCRRAHLR